MAGPEQFLVELDFGDGDLVEPWLGEGIARLECVDDLGDQRAVELRSRSVDRSPVTRLTSDWTIGWSETHIRRPRRR